MGHYSDYIEEIKRTLGISANEDIFSSQKGDYIHAKKILCYFLRGHEKLGYKKIANITCLKNHVTVIHHYNTTKNRLALEKKYAEFLTPLIARLNSIYQLNKSNKSNNLVNVQMFNNLSQKVEYRYDLQIKIESTSKEIIKELTAIVKDLSDKKGANQPIWQKLHMELKLKT